jgi:hypothetical protein
MRLKALFSFTVAALVAGPTIAGPVYATYEGSQLGITDRNANLVQNQAITTGVQQSGISVTGNGNRIYTTAQNTIREYNNTGSLVNLMTFGDAAINYTGIDTSGGKVFATYTGSQRGVTIRNGNLVQQSAFSTGLQASDLAVTPGGSIFLTADNGIYEYSQAGSLLNQMIFPDAGVNYTGIDYGYGRLFASYNGSQLGFTIRDLGLNQLSFFNLGFDITGIAVGTSSNVFLTSGNSIYEYDFFGNQLNVMNFSDRGILYSAIDVTGVPEPQSWAMLIAGFGLVGGVARRRKQLGLGPSAA